jgi:hypothetical protein
MYTSPAHHALNAGTDAGGAITMDQASPGGVSSLTIEAMKSASALPRLAKQVRHIGQYPALGPKSVARHAIILYLLNMSVNKALAEHDDAPRG